MGIPQLILALSFAITGFIFLITSKYRDRAMSVLIGVSAGLVSVQLLRVHVFTILVVIWFFMPKWSINRGSGSRIALVMASALILAITAMYGDLVVSPTLALQLTGLALSSSLIMAKASFRDRQHMLSGLLAITTLGSAFAVLQVAKIIPIDLWHADISSVGRPTGIYPEPDWLGLLSAIGLILAWRLPVPAKLRILCITLNAASLVLAFARAAWIGFAVSLAIVVGMSFISSRRRQTAEKPAGRKSAVLLTALAGGLFLLINQSFANDLAKRLQGSVSVSVSEDDISGQARVRQINGLLHMAETAPWYGHGLSANGRVSVWGLFDPGEGVTNAVNSNWLLAFWVDGKILALPLICLLLALAVATWRSIPGQLLVVILVSSLFSNATFFPVLWLVVALALLSSIKDDPVPENAFASARPISSPYSRPC